MRLGPAFAGRFPGIREQWRQLLAVGVAVVAVLIVVLALYLSRDTLAFGYDFAAYYAAANRLGETGSPYQVETLSGPFRPGPGGLYLYSPALALALLPIAQLPFDVATLLWLIPRLGLLAVTCALLPLSRNSRLALFGIVSVNPSAFEDLNLGNVSLIVTFLAVVAWRTLDRPISGVAVALAALLRPPMALIGAWWLLRRRFVPVAVAAMTFAAVFVITLPFVGVHGWLDFITVLRNVSDVTGVNRNFDVASLALRLGAPTAVVTAIVLAGYLFAAAAVLLSLRRDRDLGFAVTIGATLLASPLLWNHYMVHLLVPAAFLASRGRPWAIGLPLLTWLPHELLGFVALAATFLPFLAADPRADADPLARSSPRASPARQSI